MKNNKQYYKELGKMVYAVAMADGEVQPEEIDTVHRFVSKVLSLHESETDSSGMNKAFYVDFEFEEQLEHPVQMEEVVQSYMRFLKQNFETGDERLIKFSVNLLEAVAMAYSRSKEKSLVSHIRGEINRFSPGILLNK